MSQGLDSSMDLTCPVQLSHAKQTDETVLKLSREELRLMTMPEGSMKETTLF